MLSFNIKATLIAITTLGLSSCERVLMEEDLSSKDPQTNFDYLWSECNEKYSFFNLKNIDWEAKKSEYSAKLYNGMSDDSLFNVLGGLLTELRDDHANLVSDYNISFFGVNYLGQDNFDWRIITDHYIGHNYQITGPFSHNHLANKEIGYIRYSSFENSMDEDQLDYVLKKYADTKGLIFDIRENGGGIILNVFQILSRFISESQVVYYSRIKSGVGHNDFTEPEAVNLEPSSYELYTKPVIVLTDRGSYSSSSIFALAARSIDNLTLIGDTTGGGLGMPNGGQLPNGWTYRFSITQCLNMDLSPEYENGVPPNETVLFDWNNLEQDEVLERAIELILN